MADLTATEVRKIFAATDFTHAEFCVEQETTQIGREAAEPLHLELAAIFRKMNKEFGQRMDNDASS